MNRVLRGGRSPGRGGRLSDRGETVPDDTWDQAAAHYEPEIPAAPVVVISTITA
jgi:hypothetical protein